MSSDPNQPPAWWNQQDPPAGREHEAPQGNQGYQGPQSNQGYRGYQGPQGDQDPEATQRFRVNRGYQGPQGDQDPEATQRFRVNRGYQGPQGNQGLPANQEQQAAQYSQGYQGKRTRVRRRRRRWPLITLIVIIIVLVGGDRAACAIAENQMASQVQQQGFPAKPHVSIEGIPFLTQLAAKDFKTVVISASNVTVGPLEIASLNATIHGMHINSSFSGATVDSINGTALITFGALAHAGGIPQGIQLTADGPNKVKATINVAIINTSVVAQVTKTGPYQFNVKVLNAGNSDIPSSILGNLANFNINVPKSALPAGLTISSVSVTQQGLQVTVSGHNTTLSQ